MRKLIMILASAALINAVFQAGLQAQSPSASGPGTNAPDFRISPKVAISVPDKAIEESFKISADLLVDMRRIAFQCYHQDGWLAVSDGTNGPQQGYDPRDFRFGPKCAAYLWGDDPTLMSEMGNRIFFDEHDKDGKLGWDLARCQCGIHVAQVAKHFSDYLRYGDRDQFVVKNWDRLLKITKWTLAEYDPNNDGLIENGWRVPNRLWAYLVGEPENSFILDHTENDVVVVASMEVCEWLLLMADYGERHHLAETDWLRAKAVQSRKAIETLAYDSDAGAYYLLRRTKEKKWYHSGGGINEESRELDVTPYYAAFVGGNDSRGRNIADYARRAVLDHGVFAMPLSFPVYYWTCTNYPYHGGVSGGCWEESYYNCVRAFAKYGMLDAAYESVKRRSEAYVRDRGCAEWFTLKEGQGSGRDRYGITAAGHLSAIIEGLFGITPTAFGFGEVNIWPAMPPGWAGKPVAITVTLPDGGFLNYTYLFDPAKKTVTLTVNTDKQRQCHFRVPVPGLTKSVLWNQELTRGDVSTRADGRWEFVSIDRAFTEGQLRIELE